MDDILKKVEMLKKSGGLLYDEGDNAVKAGAFAQTPKFNQDSAQQDTMARFYLGASLVKAVETFYTMDKSVSPSLNALADPKKGYFDFFLTNISESVQDRYQLSETMGENFVVYGFNSAPIILTCTGVLKNTTEDDWQIRFLDFFKKMGGVSALSKFYQNAASGSKASSNIENFVKFVYNKKTVRGALLNVSYSFSASNELDTPFSFSFLVTGVGETGAQSTTSVTDINDLLRKEAEANLAAGVQRNPRSIASTESDTVKADGSPLLDKYAVTSHAPFNKFEMDKLKEGIKNATDKSSQEVATYVSYNK